MDEEKKGGGLGAVGVGMATGGLLGAKIGIAGFFGAISGAVPLALLGAYVGHKVYKAATSEGDTGKSTLRAFTDGVKEGYAEKDERLRVQRRALTTHVPVAPPRKKPKPPGRQ